MTGEVPAAGARPAGLTRLGRSGITVSRIGLGLAALGRPGYINLGHGDDLAGRASREALRAHAVRMMDLAYGWGVRYFDAARSYGEAEAFVAGWLGGGGGPDAAVGSKWGYTYTAGWSVAAEVHEVKTHDVGTLVRQLSESRAILGDRIDLYQIHSATNESGVLEDGEVLAGLASLKEEGVAIGLTTSGPRQVDTIAVALALEADGELLFDAVQSTWNLLEPSAGTVLAEAADAGLGVIVKEAVANGRLTPRAEGIPRAVQDAGATADAVAIAAVLAQPWADVVLSGAVTRAQLESNLGALAVDPTVIQELPDVSEDPEEYWAKRSQMPWT